jgi:hypothetical protein
MTFITRKATILVPPWNPSSSLHVEDGMPEVSEPTVKNVKACGYMFLALLLPLWMTLHELKSYLKKNSDVLQVLQRQKEGIFLCIIGNHRDKSIVDDDYVSDIPSFFDFFKIKIGSFWATHHQIRLLESLLPLIMKTKTMFLHLSHGDLCPGNIVKVLKKLALMKVVVFNKLRITDNATDLLDFVDLCIAKKVDGISEMQEQFTISRDHPKKGQWKNFVHASKIQTQNDHQQARLSEMNKQRKQLYELIDELMPGYVRLSEKSMDDKQSQKLWKNTSLNESKDKIPPLLTVWDIIQSNAVYKSSKRKGKSKTTPAELVSQTN